MKIFSRLKSWSDSRGISQQPVSQNEWSYLKDLLESTHTHLKYRNVQGYVLNKIEELQEYADAMYKNNENDAIDAIADSSVFDLTELVKMGYDIELVMDEVLKVIESRTGVWDENLGKFQKDKSPEAQARWYTPNYIKNSKLPINNTGSLF